MALGGTIFGYITTPWGIMHPAARAHTLRVLHDLPRNDTWPPLIRKMFGITGPSVLEGAYDWDLIHFGATLKGMDFSDAHQWIAKFESLLGRLIWWEASLQIDWIFGPCALKWKADTTQVWEMLEGKPRAKIDKWTFDDGGHPIPPPSEY